MRDNKTVDIKTTCHKTLVGIFRIVASGDRPLCPKCKKNSITPHPVVVKGVVHWCVSVWCDSCISFERKQYVMRREMKREALNKSVKRVKRVKLKF